jgi:capsular exopolysaccharide synthesis family protein
VGEISEALRRARLERVSQPASSEPPPTSPGRDVADALPPPRHAASPEAPPRVEIADTAGECRAARVVVLDSHGAPAEAARHLALRVRRELELRRARSLAVISSERAEGKTTVACNLALAIASLSRGRSVALVDLDLRKPSVAQVLAIPGQHGIDDVLRGSRPLAAARVEIEKPALDVFPTRIAHQNAHELLVSARFPSVVAELEQRYEVVVFDTPPTLLVPDASVIVEHVGAAIAVSRAGRTRRRALEHMVEMLPPGKLIGAVLNEGALPGAEREYGYYGGTSSGD